MKMFYCVKRNLFERIFFLNSLHNWQVRARNRYGLSTHEVCLKCGIARERNEQGKSPEFIECERIEEFDNQFNKKGIYEGGI